MKRQLIDQIAELLRGCDDLALLELVRRLLLKSI